MASRNLLVNTGNILSLKDFKKKAGQNPSEELIEALKINVNESPSNYVTLNTISSNENLSLTDIERSELKTSVKVFIPQANKKALVEALDHVLTSLDAGSIESVVISHDPAGKTPEDILVGLKELWPVVELYVQDGKVSSAGVSDVDADSFIQLHQWAGVRKLDFLSYGISGPRQSRGFISRTLGLPNPGCVSYTIFLHPQPKDIKPNIVQINLASCCVVPPALQEFTKKNFVQLLTHSDPCQILPPEAITGIFGPDITLNWVARYQVHVKCRGVLISKGYLVSLKKKITNSG